uniref:Uncharacterized protein n=1 Tax=Lepeophtheirus salmonis TaxID=72036 RepID=A0A0K2TUD6_LEPSM
MSLETAFIVIKIVCITINLLFIQEGVTIKLRNQFSKLLSSSLIWPHECSVKF